MRIIVVMSVLFGSSFASKECATGKNCEQTCMANCRNCSKNNVCEQCESGYFLINYLCQKCPPNCISCSSLYKCGNCKDGFYNGHVYDDSRYPLQTNCSLSCNKTTCSSCTSYKKCASCYSGKYGSNCQGSCSVGCKNHKCNFTTGMCECTQNFQGDYCNRCTEDQYGSKCDKPCSHTCKVNICERNGSCTECKEGFTGENCQKECERCKPGTACGRYNGICVDCIEGYYSNNCDSRCSKNCKSCFRNNAHHCMSCQSGRYGKTLGHKGQEYTSCHQDCPDHCLNKTCTLDSGECDRGCVKGHWGVKCNNTCSDDCTDDECFQNNGTCFSRKTCDANRFGKTCENFCHRNCAANENGRSCNSLSGHCVSDCLPGYFGDFCGIKCSGNCRNTSCHKDGGICLYGCIDGYKGDKCDLQESIQHGTGSCFSLVVGASIASACLTAVMILVIVLLRRKCKNQRDKPNKHNKSNVKKNGHEETALVCIEPTTNQSDNEAVMAFSGENHTPAKVNDVATVYESLTVSGTEVRQLARLCSTDYTSLALEVIPALDKQNICTEETENPDHYYSKVV